MSKAKLSKADWEYLYCAYTDAVEVPQGTFGRQGVHMILIGVLDKLGYSVRSYEQAVKKAEKLLWG